MTLTALQRTNFFTAGVQMGLSGAQRTALANEGLVTEADFIDFKEDEIKTAFKNMRSSIPGVPGVPGIPEQVNAEGNVILPAVPAIAPIPGYQAIPIPARCASRILVASIAWNYYHETGRASSQNNMHFQSTLRNFKTEWDAIITLSKQAPPKIPVLSKTNPPLRWSESFKNVCYNTFGVRTVPLSYIIREKTDVVPETGTDAAVTYDPCVPDKAHGSSGSVLDDLIHRTSHTHPLYKQDNATVFTMIEEAARGTHFSNTIQPFKNRKNGRGAWLALLLSHVGEDKWENITKLNSAWLMTTKWNGKKYSLELYCSHHRSKHSQLVEASQHVQYQVPDEHTRVGYLLDNIEHQDADLRAAIAQIRTNAQGTRDDFEQSVAILLPVDPFTKAPAHKPKVSFEISSTGATKFGRGKETGVDLRWHKREEFSNLTSASKNELRAWQKTAEGTKVMTASRNAHFANIKERDTKKRPGRENDRGATKKLRLQVASLQQQIDEQSKLSEIAAVFKEGQKPNSTVSNTNAEEKSISMARKVMKIVGREKKSTSE